METPPQSAIRPDSASAARRSPVQVDSSESLHAEPPLALNPDVSVPFLVDDSAVTFRRQHSRPGQGNRLCDGAVLASDDDAPDSEEDPHYFINPVQNPCHADANPVVSEINRSKLRTEFNAGSSYRRSPSPTAGGGARVTIC